MKTLFYFTFAILFLLLGFACKKKSKVSHVDYEYTITFNGETNKIKGNTAYGIPYYSNGNLGKTDGNYCFAYLNQVIWLEVLDVTAKSYVSGHVMKCTIVFQDLALGVNKATVRFSGSYFWNFGTSLGGFIPDCISAVKDVDQGYDMVPINITDLGEAPTASNNTNTDFPLNHHRTINGNFSGIVYLFNSNSLKYDIPFQLTIDFKAVRTDIK